MPGIAGLVSARSPEECERTLAQMIATMRHRADLASGMRSERELGVYSGWVAHRKSQAERVSGHADTRDVALVFAGECFRYTSATTGDAPFDPGNVDWWRQQYRRDGIDFFAGLNGLFSGLLVDRAARRAFLFNDRFGSERLYHVERDGEFYFASEAKALLAILPELRDFDDRGVSDFLRFGSVLHGRTLFRDITQLPGASLCSIDAGPVVHKRRYFLPTEWEAQPQLDAKDFDAEFSAVFRGALGSYLTSDTGPGISITGGLDTRMIMACAGAALPNAACYTFAGLSGDTLDARLGERVASACGLPHQSLRIGPDFLANFGRHVDETVYVTDGCAGVLGAHEIYFNALARQIAPTRITGNFGSEVLRSMSTFKPAGLSGELIDAGFVQSSLKGTGQADDAAGNAVTHAAFEEIPWHLFGTFAAARSQLTVRSPYLDNDVVRVAYRAPPSSRHSPESALKLIAECNPALARIPTDRGLLRDHRTLQGALWRPLAAVTFKLDYLYTEGLPGWLTPLDPLLSALAHTPVIGLHKYLPYRRWFRRELLPYATKVLADLSTRPSRFWNPRFLRTMAGDHARGRANYLREIHAVLTLEAVDRLLLRRSPLPPSNPLLT